MTQSSLSSNSRLHTVPASAPKPAAGGSASKYDANPSGIVVGLTLSLSWQLAIVVLVPILGGHFLDGYFKTGMWLTVLGFFLAMVGMIFTVRRTLQQLNELMKKPASDTDKAETK